MENFKIAYLNSNNGHSVLAFGKGESIRFDSKLDYPNSILDELEKFIGKQAANYLAVQAKQVSLDPTVGMIEVDSAFFQGFSTTF